MTISAYYHCAFTHSLHRAHLSNICVAHHESDFLLVEAQHRLTVTRLRNYLVGTAFTTTQLARTGYLGRARALSTCCAAMVASGELRPVRKVICVPAQFGIWAQYSLELVLVL